MMTTLSLILLNDMAENYRKMLQRADLTRTPLWRWILAKLRHQLQHGLPGSPHRLHNTATRAAPCSSQRATTPIHTPLNQRRIELETRHRTRIRVPPSSAFLLTISKCPTHFARASRRATTRCLRRVTMRYHLTYSNTFCCYAWLCRLDIHCAHVVGLVRGQFR